MDDGSTDGTKEMVNSYSDQEFFIIGKKIQADLQNQEIMELKFLKGVGLHF